MLLQQVNIKEYKIWISGAIKTAPLFIKLSSPIIEY